MCWPVSSIVDNVQFGTGQTVGIVALFWRMFEVVLFHSVLQICSVCFIRVFL